MKFKVLREKEGFKEFIRVEYFNDYYGIYTSTTPQLLSYDCKIEDLIDYYKSNGYDDIDLSEFELIDYVVIEEQTIYPKLLYLLKPVLNLLSFLKLDNNNNNNKDDENDKIFSKEFINNTIIETEDIFGKLKTLFDE